MEKHRGEKFRATRNFEGAKSRNTGGVLSEVEVGEKFRFLQKQEILQGKKTMPEQIDSGPAYVLFACV